jgi:hypothetical protein
MDLAAVVRLIMQTGNIHHRQHLQTQAAAGLGLAALHQEVLVVQDTAT